MTDLETLHRAVRECPGDDTPRLLLADELADSRDASDRARSEFIRVQIELARGWPFLSQIEVDDDTENITASPRFFKLKRRERELLEENEMDWMPGCLTEIIGGAIVDKAMGRISELPWKWSRGFVSSLTLTWQDWLAHADKLVWWPGQMMECPTCSREFPGWVSKSFPEPGWFSPLKPCPQCCPEDAQDRMISGGTHRVHRPIPPTCQPIETVRLTTVSHRIGVTFSQQIPDNAGIIRFATNTPGIGAVFTRLKCSACDGGGNRVPVFNAPMCGICHGRPLNRWHCETWPRIVFEMPGS